MTDLEKSIAEVEQLLEREHHWICRTHADALREILAAAREHAERMKEIREGHQP